MLCIQDSSGIIYIKQLRSLNTFVDKCFTALYTLGRAFKKWSFYNVFYILKCIYFTEFLDPILFYWSKVSTAPKDSCLVWIHSQSISDWTKFFIFVINF